VWEDDGGELTANILTIVARCVSHGLNPRESLLVVTNALLAGTDDIAALLPPIELPQLTPSWSSPASTSPNRTEPVPKKCRCG